MSTSRAARQPLHAGAAKSASVVCTYRTRGRVVATARPVISA